MDLNAPPRWGQWIKVRGGTLRQVRVDARGLQNTCDPPGSEMEASRFPGVARSTAYPRLASSTPLESGRGTKRVRRARRRRAKNPTRQPWLTGKATICPGSRPGFGAYFGWFFSHSSRVKSFSGDRFFVATAEFRPSNCLDAHVSKSLLTSASSRAIASAR